MKRTIFHIILGLCLTTLLALLTLLRLDRAYPPDIHACTDYSPVVHDRHGAVLHSYLTADGKRRLPPGALPDTYQKLLLNYEDRRYYAHHGIEIRSILRALWQNLHGRRTVSGASTLTMQAARLNYHTAHDLGGKIKQSLRALQLEYHYDKATILNCYATLAPMGGNLEGIRAGAWYYFGKAPAELSTSETAWLIALPQSPNRLADPVRARAARDRILDSAAASGIISEETLRNAKREPLHPAPHPFPQHAPHYAALARSRGETTTTLDRDQQTRLETILAAALPCAWADMPKKHRDTPQFAVVGYGKLGGKELGYASDLDLVYLYDDPHPDAGDVYSRLARRLTNWLSAATGAGSLYETDLRLRPNGDAGFLAHSIAAFEKYQRENAWTWEHQSLTRARFICGTPDVQTAFDRIRTEMLTAERDQTVLAGEIIEMREKMFPTHPPADNNVKYARGGVVDVEFIVQYLILAHARQYPQLLDNYGNIALLNIAADCGLIDKTLAEQSRTAYRFYRQQQHNTKLRDAKKTEVTDELLTHYGNVRKLWQEVFGAEVKFG